MEQVKQLGQAVQIGDRLYLIKDNNELWRIGAVEMLHRSGTFTLIGRVPDVWTAEDLNKAIEADSEKRWKERQRERHARNHELGLHVTPIHYQSLACSTVDRNDLDQ